MENIFNSIISQSIITNITNKIKLSRQNNSINKKQLITNNNIKQYIQTNFNLNNKQNNIHHENLSNYFLDKAQLLNKTGLEFEFSTENAINITNQDILFPICCVGKNRSQYLFYFLKVLQVSYPDNTFQVGFPASADELSTIIDSTKNSILSGFIVPHKSDTFSKSINMTLLQNEVSRSSHIFDSLLKTKEEFTQTELKNLEKYKYKTSNYDIVSEGPEKEKVKELFTNYFINSVNLRNIANYRNTTYQNYRITYICASPESYINMINLFYWMFENDSQTNFNNVRIVYLGVQDIFQRSSVNKLLLDELYNKITNSFIII